MVTALHHGKNLVDAIAGRDKYDIMNGFIHGLDPATRGEFFQKLSGAEKFCKFLNNKERGAGGTKHKPSADKRTLKNRDYEVTNYDGVDDGKTGIPAKKCNWKVAANQWNRQPKKPKKPNGDDDGF